MLQRLRDAEDERKFGEFSGKEGDIVSGLIQQGRNPDDVMVDLGKLEALLPSGERVPGEDYSHGTRIKCLVISVRKGMRGPQVMLSRTHPSLVKKLFALEVPEIADGTVEIHGIAREAGHRTKIAVKSNVPGVNAKGSCIGPMGQRVRDVMNELHGEKIDIIDWSDDPATLVGNALSPARVSERDRGRRGRPLGARRGAGLPALARDRQGGPERPPGRAAHRLAHRHPLRRRAPIAPPVAPPTDCSAAADPVHDQLGHQVVVVAVLHSGKSKTATISCSGYVGGAGQRRTSSPSTLKTASWRPSRRRRCGTRRRRSAAAGRRSPGRGRGRGSA